MARIKFQTKRQGLAAKAVRLHKTFLMFTALTGCDEEEIGPYFKIPDFHKAPKETLQAHIHNTESTLYQIAKDIFVNWDRSKLSSASIWLEQRFDDWSAKKEPIFELGRVSDVESKIGKLIHHEFIYTPPYGQVLLQGTHGAAIRYPEYHLATDLALLYNLFLDAQAIIDDLLKRNILHSTEHVQSLGRSVILTCFNLLESFVSGIAAAHLMENPGTSEEILKALSDEGAPLRTRFFRFPGLITGRIDVIDPNKQPMKELFGDCKDQRDAFVHCQPGPDPSKRGVIKEEQFHDITVDGVRKTVGLTCEAICLVWREIHGKDRPTWLPSLDELGRFPRVQVELRSVDHVGS